MNHEGKDRILYVIKNHAMKTYKKVQILLHALFNLASHETIGKPFSIQCSSISERAVLFEKLSAIARFFL
jgi:hypothetical protein